MSAATAEEALNLLFFIFKRRNIIFVTWVQTYVCILVN